MLIRKVAGIVVLALVSIAGTATGTTAAPTESTATKVFANAQFGYTLSYPAIWRRVPAASLDILLEAPDGYARVAGKAVGQGLSTAGLRQILDGTIGQFGAPAAKVVRTTRVIHGVTFQVAQATGVVINGEVEQATVLAASRHQQTYLFFGIVALDHQGAGRRPAHVKDELGQVAASISSITIQR